MKSLNIIESRSIDLILLDYEMPDIDGSEAMKLFRENPASKDIPIIFLTAVSEKKRIAEVIALNPEAYLLKPLNAEKLYEVVKKVIG